MTTNNRMNQAVGIIVALTVGLLLVAFLIPVALEELAAVETVDWSDGAASLFGILDLIAILVVFLVFIGWAMKAS